MQSSGKQTIKQPPPLMEMSDVTQAQMLTDNVMF